MDLWDYPNIRLLRLIFPPVPKYAPEGVCAFYIQQKTERSLKHNECGCFITSDSLTSTPNSTGYCNSIFTHAFFKCKLLHMHCWSHKTAVNGKGVVSTCIALFDIRRPLGPVPKVAIPCILRPPPFKDHFSWPGCGRLMQVALQYRYY
jgi:hypothetical protein